MIYRSFSTDSKCMEVINIQHLASLKFDNYGEARAQEFYDEWNERVSRLDLPLEEGHKRDMLLQQMKKFLLKKIST